MFENLHSNHKLAFLDGTLCGVALVFIGRIFYKAYDEGSKRKKLAQESIDNDSL